MCNRLTYSLLAATLFLYVGVIQAEISADDLPSMGNIAALIGKADKTKVEKEVYDKNGRISANLPVPNTERDDTADEIARLLSNGSTEQQEKMRAAIAQERIVFEKFLTDSNFQVNDMGVALAAALIGLWELASGKILPAEAKLAAGKHFVYSFQGMRDQYGQFKEAEKEAAYDWFMTTPVAFASMIAGLEKNGKMKEAQALRGHCATLFQDAFKMPHDMLTISQTGELGVDIEKIQQYQKQQGLDGGW